MEMFILDADRFAAKLYSLMQNIMSVRIPGTGWISLRANIPSEFCNRTINQHQNTVGKDVLSGEKDNFGII